MRAHCPPERLMAFLGNKNCEFKEEQYYSLTGEGVY
jgi:hypothetical protein